MNPSVDRPLLKTIHSGWIGQGSKVEEFERELSDRINNPNCLTLSAGTHGLHLALVLAGVGPGDSVVTTPLTCTASNWPIAYQGAKPIWADAKRDDLNIDPDSVRRRITKRTKAIMCVHWGGYPCDMEELCTIANEYNCTLIEDGAHAFGATYKDSIIGDCAYSNFTMFSFQAIKHLTCVDGGALFCRKRSDHIRGKLLRWYGINREGPRIDMRCEADIPEIGWKYHMNDVCATVGLSNLKKVDANIRKARGNANYYRRNLSGTAGVTLIQNERTAFLRIGFLRFWLRTARVSQGKWRRRASWSPGFMSGMISIHA